MDINDKSEIEKSEETLSYDPPGLPTDWHYNGANVVNSSMGVVLPNRDHMGVCGDGVGPSSSSGSMVDSFGPAVWEHLVNPTAALGFSEINMPNGVTPDPLSLLKGSAFLPNMSGVLPHSSSQFPADSAFIERAARFSSFNGGHFSDVLNPFSLHQPNHPYMQGGTPMRGSQELVSSKTMKTVPNRQSLETGGNAAEISKDGSLPSEHGVIEGSPPKNESAVERSCEEAKQGVSMCADEFNEAGFSSNGGQEDGTPSSAKGFNSKKRKWGNQDTEPKPANDQSGEAGKNETENQSKVEHNSTPTSNKSNGINSKQNSQASDSPKEEYIHVRARRGQATNSHSLAERVRREKISERMKFLQDLVPGCSKVTGKAVMLDEIINYVQSLQRQVEFLSMKLATVNPRMDFDVERLIAKDQMFSARAGPSGSLGFSPDTQMAYPPLHPTQQSVLHPGLPGIGNYSGPLRRTITSQLTSDDRGCKEPAPQLPSAWVDELHNIVQMGFNASTALENQETNCSVPSGQMKAEP